MSENINTLFEQLSTYTSTPAYPFHMPGHKRLFGVDEMPYKIDITEIDNFDNLHAPCGIIKRIENKLAAAFDSDHAFMLVNGSTGGILSAISAVSDIGDDIIIARNCHKSVYNAAMIRRLNAEYIYPETDENGICQSIKPEDVSAAIEKAPHAKSVVLTSPTYEGVVSDIESIAKICHEHNIPLVTDSAHGAHMKFCAFGQKGESISGGADIVIKSLHKTLPALTQTAAAFLNSDLISEETFRNYLEIYQTSSPSYPLMASIELCIDHITAHKDEFKLYEQRLHDFYEKMSDLKHLQLLSNNNYMYSRDIGKIIITTFKANITGYELMKKLRDEYQLELEMSMPTYSLAMTSICDSVEGFERLAQALKEIDSTLKYEKKEPFPPLPRPRKADPEKGEKGETRSIYIYPPGIPIVAAGEVCGENELRYLKKWQPQSHRL
ncbi:MAG: aminotransferase class I/II-fold pyridoxal phosphate-dependent enzyme [Clostridia bacterium]|nr:aminotransferase class I/II-fold pyridoxal phosphate-dependent enzyme [Clostridia bacterium]